MVRGALDLTTTCMIYTIKVPGNSTHTRLAHPMRLPVIQLRDHTSRGQLPTSPTLTKRNSTPTANIRAHSAPAPSVAVASSTTAPEELEPTSHWTFIWKNKWAVKVVNSTTRWLKAVQPRQVAQREIRIPEAIHSSHGVLPQIPGNGRNRHQIEWIL